MPAIKIQTASKAPAAQVHGNSMLPKVRAVLDRGLGTEWSSGDVQELLGMSERSALYLFENGLLHTSRYPTKEGPYKAIRRTSGLSLLIYILNHSDEITEADAQPIIKKVLPLLTDQILEGVIGACRSLISKRSGVLVAVKQPEAKTVSDTATPALAETATLAHSGTVTRTKADPYAGTPDLFSSTSAGSNNTTP